MRRTEWLQETRKMRFEEAYEGWQARRLTQEEAARLLGWVNGPFGATLRPRRCGCTGIRIRLRSCQSIFGSLSIC